MKNHKLFLVAAALLAVGSTHVFAASAKPAKSAADIEKEKALASPYPNDFGPETLDQATLDSYPKNIQEGYNLLRGSDKKRNCQACHTSARPLNSRFVEPEGKDDAAKTAAVAQLKKDHPEYFKDPGVWQIEAGIWKRYVKRMMAKPGCGISNEDGKKIWQFLVYDGAHRKIGAAADQWKAHRQKLIDELKAKNSARYEELKKDNDL